MDRNIERLHRAIVEAVRQTRGNDLDRPVTVAEIYQTLVPYRAARAAIGFEMNADYEYALLRLLAGEGDLARLEPSEIRESLRMELDSPNPNVSLYRDYANCDVFLAAPGAELEPAEFPVPRNGARFVPIEDDDEPEEDDIEPDPLPIVQKAAASPHECSFCGGDLPAGRLANFCPHCGSDLSQRPCSTCGEILDPIWRFCINCGASATAYDQDAN